MTIVVEDGTGLTNAVSYASVAESDAYFAARSVTSWASNTEAQKEAALIKATDYIETRFSLSFKGTRQFETQALSWPRYATLDGVDLMDTVPVRLKRATMEYAFAALTTELVSTPTDQNVAGEITLKREKIGPIEREFEYSVVAKDGVAVHLKTFPAADMLVADLLSGYSSVTR